jgi:hypothetical protein
MNDIKVTLPKNISDALRAASDPSTGNPFITSDGLGSIQENISAEVESRLAGEAAFQEIIDGMKTINGESLLGGGNIDISTTTRNIVYLSKAGNDATGVAYDISKPFLTPEAARDAASVGDTIKPFPGDYTVITTDANGLAKDGINWDLCSGVKFAKSSSGAMFKTDGFTIGFNIYGKGTFIGAGACGVLFNYTNSTIDYTFEFEDAVNSSSYCFYFSNSQGRHSISCRNIISSGSTCIHFNQYGTYDITFNNIISTASNAISIFNGSVTANFRGSMIQSTTSVAIGSVYYTTLNIQVANIYGVGYGIYCIDHGDVNFSGNTNGIYFATGAGNFHFNGHCDHVKLYSGNFVGGTVGYIETYGGFINTTCTGYGYSYYNVVYVFGGVAVVEMANAIPSIYCNDGTLILRGKIKQPTEYEDRVIYGTGTVIMEADIEWGGDGYNSGRPIFYVYGAGTLRIKSKVHNKSISVNTPLIRLDSGNLILDGATLMNDNADWGLIQVTAAGLNVRVMTAGVSTNRPELGGLLSAKKQKDKFTIDSVAPISITLDDGTGATTFSETDIVTYNTKTLLAQRLDSLINSSVTINVQSYYTGPDEFIVLENTVAGDPVAYSGLANLSRTTLRLNSYTLTEIVGGTIIENANVI